MKIKNELIWKAIYSGTETASGKFPARIPREILCHWIYILLLNMGNKEVAKIKWWHALDVEALETCLEQVKRHFEARLNATKPRKGWDEDIKILLSSWGLEKQDFKGLLWGQLFRRYCWNCMDRAYGPMAQSKDANWFEGGQLR